MFPNEIRSANNYILYSGVLKQSGSGNWIPVCKGKCRSCQILVRVIPAIQKRGILRNLQFQTGTYRIKQAGLDLGSLQQLPAALPGLEDERVLARKSAADGHICRGTGKPAYKNLRGRFPRVLRRLFIMRRRPDISVVLAPGTQETRERPLWHPVRASLQRLSRPHLLYPGTHTSTGVGAYRCGH